LQKSNKPKTALRESNLARAISVRPLVQSNDEKLTVNVINGTDLISCDKNGFSDPYVIVTFKEHKQRTTTQKKTLNPQWNNIFTFDISTESDMDQEIEFTVMDWDKMKKDDYMGECSRPLSFALENQGKTCSLPLEAKIDEKVSGQIYVQFTFD